MVKFRKLENFAAKDIQLLECQLPNCVVKFYFELIEF